MDQWAGGMREVLKWVLGHPFTPLQEWITLGLAALVLVGVITWMGKVTAVPRVGRYLSLAVALAGGIAFVAAVTAAAFYVLPNMATSHQFLVLLAAGVIGSSLVAVPLMGMIQRATILAGLSTWLVSLFFSGLVIAILSGVFSFLHRGAHNIEQTRSRTLELQRFLGQP